MKIAMAFIAVGLSLAPEAAKHEKKVDWGPCKAAEDSMSEQVAKFNSARSGGPELRVECVYAGDDLPPRAPERRIDIEASEARKLNTLRVTSHSAYEAEANYESLLMLKYGVPRRELGDPCYNFVGFITDDDFITYDPNSMMASDGCEYPLRGVIK